MVNSAGRKSGGVGTVRRKRTGVEAPGLKRDRDFTTSAKRALALRRFWVFLLAFALVMIGLVSAVGARLF